MEIEIEKQDCDGREILSPTYDMSIVYREIKANPEGLKPTDTQEGSCGS